ncbi:MAG: hypothetical protein ACRDD1_16915, partial [Planctomycetia bacterium]
MPSPGCGFYLDFMPHLFDATLKSIVAASPGDFATLFGLPSGARATAVNVDLSIVSAATDVALAIGDPITAVIDLNFQTGPAPALPTRLLLYNVLLHQRYGVPVRTILALMRPKADGPHLTGNLSYRLGGGRVEFDFEILRLWEVPVEVCLVGGLSLLPLAVLCRMPDDKPLPMALRDVVRAIEKRLGLEASHADALRLLKATSTLALMRAPKSKMGAIFEGVGLMSQLAAYDEAILEGETRGEMKGRREVLRRQGSRSFGAPDEAAEAELASIM